MSDEFRCGFVDLIGVPNVGKSTLFNRLVGQKISITSRRSQTTRFRVRGIRSTPEYQLILSDSPGVQTIAAGALGRALNRTALNSVIDSDLLALVIAAPRWDSANDRLLDRLPEPRPPVMLVINKVDLCRPRDMLLRLIDFASKRSEFAEIVPVSAMTGENCDRLERVMSRYLPARPAGYSPNTVTDRTDQFLIAEFVREQLFRQLGEELPYVTAVELQQLDTHRSGRQHISVAIWVERPAQRAIVLGRDGSRIKRIGAASRRNIENALGKPVHLTIVVEVKKGWSRDRVRLQQLGYEGPP